MSYSHIREPMHLFYEQLLIAHKCIHMLKCVCGTGIISLLYAFWLYDRTHLCVYLYQRLSPHNKIYVYVSQSLSPHKLHTQTHFATRVSIHANTQCYVSLPADIHLLHVHIRVYATTASSGRIAHRHRLKDILQRLPTVSSKHPSQP